MVLGEGNIPISAVWWEKIYTSNGDGDIIRGCFKPSA